MPDKDNQSALAGQLEQSQNTPPPTASGNDDGMTVLLPSGERIELGENPRETKV